MICVCSFAGWCWVVLVVCGFDFGWFWVGTLLSMVFNLDYSFVAGDVDFSYEL